MISGAEFVKMMMRADSVAKCAVPPGMPGMVDTTLKGFTGLGFLLRLGASHWWVQACAPGFLSMFAPTIVMFTIYG